MVLMEKHRSLFFRRFFKSTSAGPQIFAYWESRDHSLITEMTEAWRVRFPHFSVLGDDDILPLIARHFPQHIELYQKIRLASAKSDIARFLWLYEYGGLYVDCHNAIRDAAEIKRLLACLHDNDAIVFDRFINFMPRPPGEHFIISSPIFGRRHSELFMTLARQAFANLAWQQRLEQQHGFVAYTLSRLTGPLLVNETILQPGSCTRDIRVDFARRIVIIPEETAPIVRSVYRSYTTPTNHWTFRERRECLFEPSREPLSQSPDVQFHNLFQDRLRDAQARIRTEIAELRQSSEQDD